MSLSVYSKEQDEKNNKGVWKDFEGSKLRIARWLNINFIGNFLVESKEAIPNPDEVDSEGQPTAEVVERSIDNMGKFNLMCKAMSGSILTDWEGVKNEVTGEEVPFSPELGEILLRNNVQVHNFVKQVSQDLENFESDKEGTVSGE